MDIRDCYKIGFVLKPHGLKGEVTISIDEDAPNEFDELESIFLARGETMVPYFIEAISLKGEKAYVKFEDVDSADEAKAICKHALYLPKSARPKSLRGEFYDDEITGFSVTDENQGLLGTITEVTAAGPNKLIAVDHQGKEVLIPVNSPFIISVNKSKKKITVNLPDGFLDI
jgi:16S rRNA processing protein RimM